MLRGVRLREFCRAADEFGRIGMFAPRCRCVTALTRVNMTRNPPVVVVSPHLPSSVRSSAFAAARKVAPARSRPLHRPDIENENLVW